MRAPAPLVVLVGGCLGGGARLALDAWLPTGAVPWDLLAINVAGSFALGVLSALTLARGARWWTPGVTTGALGGFTTYSSVAALSVTTPLGAGMAAVVLAATMAATVLAAATGWTLAERAERRRHGRRS